VRRKEARDRARGWLDRLGLGSFATAYPAQLSGGMRQRVAIARAMVVEPEYLLMDEPFAALDAQLRELLQGELISVCERERKTVVFITHSLEEAIVLSDRVLVMTARPGRILSDVTVPFARPRDVRVRDTAEFARVRAELWNVLRTEVNRQLDDSKAGK
jgi:NitT/TauT family transport system ATP-binding protein